MPRFSPCRGVEGKNAAISEQACFSQKRVRSYIVLALIQSENQEGNSLKNFLFLFVDVEKITGKLRVGKVASFAIAIRSAQLPKLVTNLTVNVLAKTASVVGDAINVKKISSVTPKLNVLHVIAILKDRNHSNVIILQENVSVLKVRI